MNKYLRLGSRVLGRSVFLATAAIAMSGCVASQQWQRCRDLTLTPLKFQATIASAYQKVGRDLRRSSASLALYEGGGIGLYVYIPFHRFGSNNLYECHQLSRQELDRWVETIEAMASHFEKRRGESREVVWVGGAQGQNEGLAAIEDLDPESLAAVSSFACLVLETFGEHGDSVFREAGPLLASRLDLPTACALPETKQLP